MKPNSLDHGQIRPGSRMGDFLIAQAKLAETIVESGTWWGEGSTRCLAMGLVRPSQTLLSFEPSRQHYQFALRNHTDKRVILVNGHMLASLSVLPLKIDLLLLDGGDIETDDEFDALHPRSSVIVIDDTNERKNRRQLMLLKEMKWDCLADYADDRHGWAAFKRPL